MKAFLLPLLCFAHLFTHSQSVGIGTNTPAASAMLHINSTNKGLLIPRLTSVQRSAIAAPATGLQVYDTNTNSFWYFNSTAWVEIGAGGGNGGGSWTSSSANIYNNNTGNVGIGTSTPFYKLDVNGSGAFNGQAVAYGFNGQSYIFSGGTLKLSHAASASLVNSVLIDGSRIQSYYFDAGLQDEYPNAMSINPLGGNVGIGTNYAPSRKLEIYKGRMIFSGAQDAANGVHPGIEFTNDAATALRGFVGMSSDDYVGFYGYSGAGFGLVMNVNNGCVGIGTSNPDPYYKLSINGFVRAKEIRVNTGWADYVFDDEYSLRPLTEVEEYIRQYRHLPGIADAATLQKEGVDISAMQTKMMEKIEELTLYLIEANKQIEALKMQVQNSSKQ